MNKYNPIRLIVWVWHFVTHDIWQITPDDVRGAYRWLVSTAKALILSMRGFLNDRIMEKASALTYYTMLSIVPLFALILGISKGFDIQDTVEAALYDVFPGQPKTISYGFQFATKFLEHTKTGVVMGVGVAMLFYVIINLIGNIETVFNEIWQQKKNRSTIRKITDYLSIILLVPVLIVLSSGTEIFLQTFINTGRFTKDISSTLLAIMEWFPYISIYLILTFIYIVIPNTKVKFFNAFMAALVAGTAFMAFQWLFINGQIWISNYSAIYGSFAAIPIFILWIRTAWIICLYGAELSFASQNFQKYDFEENTLSISRQYRDFLTILTAAVIYGRFRRACIEQQHERYKPLSSEEISRLLHMPINLCAQIISDLQERDIIRETIPQKDKNEIRTWTPGRDVSTYTIGNLIKEINEYGETSFKYEYEKVFEHEWSVLCKMRETGYDIGHEQLLSSIELHDDKLMPTSKAITSH